MFPTLTVQQAEQKAKKEAEQKAKIKAAQKAKQRAEQKARKEADQRRRVEELRRLGAEEPDIAGEPALRACSHPMPPLPQHCPSPPRPPLAPPYTPPRRLPDEECRSLSGCGGSGEA